MTNTRELFEVDRSRRNSLNYNVNESYSSTIRSLGAQVVAPGSAITFQRKDFGGVYVPSGNYGGFTIESGKHIIKCAPGVRFDKPIIIQGTLVLSGAYIEMSDTAAGIIVADGGRLILDKCQVIKADGKHNATTDTYIRIDIGGVCSVSNCVFHGEQANTGFVVYNDNALGSEVAVLGSINLTDIASPFFNVAYTQVVP